MAGKMPALPGMAENWTKRPRLAKDKHLPNGVPQWYSRGYLPHFDMSGVTQTMTFRLADSMPESVLELWREELSHMPKKESDLERRKRIDAYLDQGHGSCYLKDDRLAGIVQNALLYYDGQRYLLHAWVVMPSRSHAFYSGRGLDTYPDSAHVEILHGK